MGYDSMGELMAGRIGHERGQYYWFTDNFIEWISELGYKIQLTGDEFEPYALSDRIA